MSTSPSNTKRTSETNRFGDNKRFYDIPPRLPSVTTILSAINKPALVNWAAKTEREMVIQAAANLYEDLPVASPKMAREVYLTTLQTRIGKQKAFQKELAKAGEIGTQAHALIEWNLRKSLGQVVGPEPQIDAKALWSFMAFQDWQKAADFKPTMIEQVVWSLEHGYAGTMDWFGTVQGVPTLGDQKTGKAIYAEALLQNAAYCHALIEMKQAIPPIQGCIVRLPKVDTDPEFEVRLIPYEDHEALFKTFLAAKALWEWQYEEEQRYEREKHLAADRKIAAQDTAAFLPG